MMAIPQEWAWIGAVCAALILYKILTRKPAASQTLSDYESELNEILNSDKNKVKGRFDQ